MITPPIAPLLPNKEQQPCIAINKTETRHLWGDDTLLTQYSPSTNKHSITFDNV